MMHDSMNKKDLDKTSLFQDYISRYKYNDINKASEDFEEIYKILEVINYAIQINRFNGHPRGDLEGEVTAMFTILCEKGVIDSYPFKDGDKYSSFSPQLRGDWLKMSEKRFTSKDYTIDYYTEIVDNEKELDPTIPNPSQRLLIGEAVDLLNEQDREIKQLKKELGKLH